MKIAVPFPDKRLQTERIKEALNLWENKEDLIICLVEPRDDLQQYHCKLLERSSTDIGTEIKNIYIYDMLKYIYETFPNEDWYGFANSDVVPVKNLIKGYEDKEAIIFHRTDILNWEDRFIVAIDLLTDLMDHETAEWVIEELKNKTKVKRICRKLNIKKITPPFGEKEWHYVNFENFLFKLGKIFNVGQDMFLFRKDVMEKVFDYDKDPIIGTAMWDVYYTRWVGENFDYARLANRIYHKKHQSEWKAKSPDWWHNGGPSTETDWERAYKLGKDFNNIDEITI